MTLYKYVDERFDTSQTPNSLYIVEYKEVDR